MAAPVFKQSVFGEEVAPPTNNANKAAESASTQSTLVAPSSPSDRKLSSSSLEAPQLNQPRRSSESYTRYQSKISAKMQAIQEKREAEARRRDAAFGIGK